MKKPILIILCSLLLFTQLSFALLKNTPPSSSLETLNTERHDARWLRYEDERKEPWIAVGAAWVIPSVGHAYAGDWGRGFPFLLADIACIGIAATGIQQKKTSTTSDSPGGAYTISSTKTEYTGAFYVGVSLLLVARIWEYIDAYNTAEEHNAEIRKELNISEKEYAEQN